MPGTRKYQPGAGLTSTKSDRLAAAPVPAARGPAAGPVPGLAPGPRGWPVIVSPCARPGFTDTTSSTFAGIPGFTEHNFGLTPPGPNDAQAYPFTNAFNFRCGRPG